MLGRGVWETLLAFFVGVGMFDCPIRFDETPCLRSVGDEKELELPCVSFAPELKISMLEILLIVSVGSDLFFLLCG